MDKRAKLLQGEYRRKAKDTARTYGGGDRGGYHLPVENKSVDLHSLLQTIAESKITAMGLSRGTEGTEAELGTVVGPVRRMLTRMSRRG